MLTGQHLYNAAYSRQSYYRAKYRAARLAHAIAHIRWKALDLLWGNGESIVRVASSGLAVILVVALVLMQDHSQLIFPDALWTVFSSFWGIQSSRLPDSYLVFLTIIRFVLLGLFMAILVKRLSRR